MGKVKDGTPKEIHAQAVALRKLTDKQLVERFEGRSKAGEVTEFLKILEESHIQGIGAVTIAKLKKFAENNRF